LKHAPVKKVKWKEVEVRLRLLASEIHHRKEDNDERRKEEEVLGFFPEEALMNAWIR
jgi:hypothetical protein